MAAPTTAVSFPRPPRLAPKGESWRGAPERGLVWDFPRVNLSVSFAVQLPLRRGAKGRSEERMEDNGPLSQLR